MNDKYTPATSKNNTAKYYDNMKFMNTCTTEKAVDQEKQF